MQQLHLLTSSAACRLNGRWKGVRKDGALLHYLPIDTWLAINHISPRRLKSKTMLSNIGYDKNDCRYQPPLPLMLNIWSSELKGVTCKIVSGPVFVFAVMDNHTGLAQRTRDSTCSTAIELHRTFNSPLSIVYRRIY